MHNKRNSLNRALCQIKVERVSKIKTKVNRLFNITENFEIANNFPKKIKRSEKNIDRIMNKNRVEFKHPRFKCGLCGMQISEKHLGRHRMRRHPNCPSNAEMLKEFNSQSSPSDASNAKKSEASSNILSADVQQTIADQSKKQFANDVRYVKVRISEPELIKLMGCGRIYHAVGKFFMRNS